MIGNYWTTGITVKQYGGKWVAQLQFQDRGFADLGATKGTLETRYFVPTLEQAIDLLVSDATSLGIEFGSGPTQPPTIYAYDSCDFPLPLGWEQKVKEQCDRLGWLFISESEVEDDSTN